ncbi:MAG TPA: 3-deoxy-manno-octulosonate-8-phosphatase KdsC [Xanthomonadales bacterium]|nr:3-deoxy-manno-octulosonate-8-phosphatase KdsC [Xanthomonadales bacterium]
MSDNPAGNLNPLLVKKAEKIRLLALDVDGVLTDGRLYFDQSGNEMKTFFTRDGLGIKALQRFDICVALITGRSSAIVARRAEELGISLVYQGCDDKLDAFNDVLEKTGCNEEQVCYAGDDWVDIPVLDRVGLAVTVPDADPLVKSRAHWVTDNGGGKGAVREICDLILMAQGLDRILLEQYSAS